MIDPLENANNTEDVQEFYMLHADRRFVLGAILTWLDTSLGADHAVLTSCGTTAPELLFMAQEYKTPSGIMEIEEEEKIFRAALGLASKHAKFPADLAFVSIPSRRMNARVVKLQSGRPVVAIDSTLFCLISHVIHAYFQLIDILQGDRQLTPSNSLNQIEKIFALASYCATGEPIFLRQYYRGGKVEVDATPIASLAQIFIVLHELGHLNLSDVSSFEAERAADKFAAIALSQEMENPVDLASSVAPLFHFQSLVERQGLKLGCAIRRADHPSASQRLQDLTGLLSVNSVPKSLAAQFGTVYDCIDHVFETYLTEFRCCGGCGRFVLERMDKAVGSNEGAFPVFVGESLFRQIGVECPACRMFSCIVPCGGSIEKSFIKCPNCHQKIAAAIPAEEFDLVALLGSPSRLDQATGAVEMISLYGLKGLLKPARDALSNLVMWSEHSDEQAANHVCRGAVTFIHDILKAKGNFQDIRLAFSVLAAMERQHPGSPLISCRQMEGLNNLCAFKALDGDWEMVIKCYTRIKSYRCKFGDNIVRQQMAIASINVMNALVEARIEDKLDEVCRLMLTDVDSLPKSAAVDEAVAFAKARMKDK